jgi:hypothetical protein
MIYLIIGLCLMAAVVSSWHLSAMPFFEPRDTRDEDMAKLFVSAHDIIRAELTAQDDEIPRHPVPQRDTAPAEWRA